MKQMLLFFNTRAQNIEHSTWVYAAVRAVCSMPMVLPGTQIHGELSEDNQPSGQYWI